MAVKRVKSAIPTWIRQLRPGFLVVGTCCVPLGVAVAWYEKGVFDASLFAITWIAALSMFAGCFLVNEYFDYKTGCDLLVAAEDLTPFSGGSRILPSGLLNPQAVFIASFPLHALALCVGFYLALTRSLLLIPLTILGFFFSYFYTAPPVRIGSRGVGELVTGLNCGPLVTLGSYLVQANGFSSLPILVGTTPGILIGTTLWVNEIPDLEADKRAGKRTTIVRIGKKRAAQTYPYLVAAAYLLLMAEALLRIVPAASLATLLTLPLTLKSSLTLSKHYANTRKLIPALRNHVLATLAFTAILAISLSTSRTTG